MSTAIMKSQTPLKNKPQMIEAVEFLREIVTKDDLWAAVSLVATLCAVGAVAYVMHYAVRMEEESVQRRLGAKGLKVR